MTTIDLTDIPKILTGQFLSIESYTNDPEPDVVLILSVIAYFPPSETSSVKCLRSKSGTIDRFPLGLPDAQDLIGRGWFRWGGTRLVRLL